MNKRELIEMLDIYHDEDEVLVFSPSGRTGRMTGLNYDEMNRTGAIVISIDFLSKEVREQRDNKPLPDSQQVRARYSYQAKDKLPWAVRFARVSDNMMIGFRTDAAYKKWFNERLRQKRNEKSLRNNTEEL